MATISEALALAIEHHQAGRLEAAEQIYREILAIEPDQANALQLVGVASSQMGRLEAAVEYIRRAIAIKGTEASFHRNLGVVLKAQGKLDEAIAAYRRGLELSPDDPIALSDMGNLLLTRERPDEAAVCFRRVLEQKPDDAVGHYNLGTAFLAQGQMGEAAACYQRALHLKPDLAEACCNLGTIFQAQEKLDEAAALYRRAVELKPDDAVAHNNLGAVLQFQGKLDEAITVYRRAAELKPDLCEAHNNLGSSYQSLGKLEEATGCFRRVVELKPGSAEGHNKLGSVLKDQRQVDEAIFCFRRALELQPNLDEVWGNLLFALQYRADASLRELAATQAEYDRVVAAPLWSSWRQHENDREAERRLRVGFVSPNFGLSPVGFFLIRALENLDRNQCEVNCYSDRKAKDRLTARFEAAASAWRDVSAWSDQELAERIRADRIDILFDLAGHTAGNRLRVFAQRPAPIQVTWAGYPGTTGLKAIDYILADRHEIPPEAEAFYSERVLRMPDGYVCYEPPSFARDVSPLPAMKQGGVTFGSFNNPAKITAQMVEVWARILDRVPRSRLVLKYKGLDYAAIANKLTREFSDQGIDPQRVECLGWSAHGKLLAEFQRIDVALDTFPYNGGLTTCEALWMGVPVITCPGETFAGRHSLSHLSNIGLMETIARDLDEYVELAVSLAGDLPRLATLRAGLRERMATSPLCDGKRFAENLMRVLRKIWREWCCQTGA